MDTLSNPFKWPEKLVERALASMALFDSGVVEYTQLAKDLRRLSAKLEAEVDAIQRARNAMSQD